MMVGKLVLYKVVVKIGDKKCVGMDVNVWVILYDNKG